MVTCHRLCDIQTRCMVMICVCAYEYEGTSVISMPGLWKGENVAFQEVIKIELFLNRRRIRGQIENRIENVAGFICLGGSTICTVLITFSKARDLL